LLQWKPIEVRTVGGSYGRWDGRSGDGRPSVRRSVTRSVSRTDRGHTHRSLKTCSVRRPATSEAVAVRRSLLYSPRARCVRRTAAIDATAATTAAAAVAAAAAAIAIFIR